MLKTQSAELCEQFGIERLSVFGSVARGDYSDKSDIDLLVEFRNPTPETMPDRYFGFVKEAERRFKRPVQVLTPRMVRNPFLKRSIQKDMVVVYE